MEGGVKTIGQAQALPEIKSEFFETWNETLPNGVTVCHQKVRPLCAHAISGDDIILFTDPDGRAMKVTYTENGPAKTEFRL